VKTLSLRATAMAGSGLSSFMHPGGKFVTCCRCPCCCRCAAAARCTFQQQQLQPAHPSCPPRVCWRSRSLTRLPLPQRALPAAGLQVAQARRGASRCCQGGGGQLRAAAGAVPGEGGARLPNHQGLQVGGCWVARLVDGAGVLVKGAGCLTSKSPPAHPASASCRHNG
jgi:hypothetical protein